MKQILGASNVQLLYNVYIISKVLITNCPFYFILTV